MPAYYKTLSLVHEQPPPKSGPRGGQCVEETRRGGFRAFDGSWNLVWVIPDTWNLRWVMYLWGSMDSSPVPALKGCAITRDKQRAAFSGRGPAFGLLGYRQLLMWQSSEYQVDFNHVPTLSISVPAFAFTETVKPIVVCFKRHCSTYKTVSHNDIMQCYLKKKTM